MTEQPRTLLQGYEVKTKGDAFMVSFHDVSDAVTFCLHIQLALLTVEWPSEVISLDSDAVRIEKDRHGRVIRRGIRCSLSACFSSFLGGAYGRPLLIPRLKDRSL